MKNTVLGMSLALMVLFGVPIFGQNYGNEANNSSSGSSRQMVEMSPGVVRELDDNTLNSPLKSKKLKVSQTWKFSGETLAAGIAYDGEHKVFYVSTDEPRGANARPVAYVLKYDMNFKLLESVEIPVDGDLEGISYGENNILHVASEEGTIYHFNVSKDLRLVSSTPALASVTRPVKIGSLAYNNGKLYFFDKNLPEKYMYVWDLQTKSLQETKLDFPQDFTIAGAAFARDELYLYSEAFSTIFRLDRNTKQVMESYGIVGARESSGMTFANGNFYLVPDFEDYIPEFLVRRVKF